LRVPAPSPLVGEGWGGGAFVQGPARVKPSRLDHPPPSPSPTRGEGIIEHSPLTQKCGSVSRLRHDGYEKPLPARGPGGGDPGATKHRAFKGGFEGDERDAHRMTWPVVLRWPMTPARRTTDNGSNVKADAAGRGGRERDRVALDHRPRSRDEGERALRGLAV